MSWPQPLNFKNKPKVAFRSIPLLELTCELQNRTRRQICFGTSIFSQTCISSGTPRTAREKPLFLGFLFESRGGGGYSGQHPRRSRAPPANATTCSSSTRSTNQTELDKTLSIHGGILRGYPRNRISILSRVLLVVPRSGGNSRASPQGGIDVWLNAA